MRVSAFAICLCLFSGVCSAQSDADTSWSFAVSGDSRNCGDVIMPAIAEGVKRDGAQFYWHLGDYRAIYTFDEDYKQTHPMATILGYESEAWQDFIDHQLAPFGTLPVYLSLGNHETIPPKTRSEAIQAFADWWDDPVIKAQRLADDPRNHKLVTYYHWIKGGVDFVTLDNGSDDMFDPAQVAWLENELKRAAADPQIRSVVLGMHRALPDSLSAGHSMNDSAQGIASGRQVYQDLVTFKNTTHKNVYVLGSHSHFYLPNVYDTACRRVHPETILPGWIVGTAGAIRYDIPKEAQGGQNELYGYLLGRVAKDGTIDFQFRPIAKDVAAIPQETRRLFTDAFVRQCLEQNRAPSIQPQGATPPPNCPK